MSRYAAALDFGSSKVALAVGEKTPGGIRIISYHDTASAGTLYKVAAASRPHLPVAHKLLTVVCLPGRIRVGITSVIQFGVGSIVVGISKNNNRIAVTLAGFGRCLSQASQQRKAHNAGCRIFKEISSVHSSIIITWKAR